MLEGRDRDGNRVLGPVRCPSVSTESSRNRIPRTTFATARLTCIAAPDGPEIGPVPSYTTSANGNGLLFLGGGLELGCKSGVQLSDQWSWVSFTLFCRQIEVK